ncbi:SusD/RagB family nutrient-binding outer membrane lipoprotein [Longibacter salinarum]|uniref:SusD/RagB family nutrient-binding outer membrane lipoprotein n=1 Tax=Longibacter salinarum TaxID=1850348 RepID=A0A2A8D0X7_9BACT|nr:SusD/RagB family nutrient-binding outer membrane lipoprotein [Longibacter salinarum]PEN14544.1 SusD/RagB family nutrient-binding outer membrane lipoprotein [Longibacter salinarum]
MRRFTTPLHLIIGALVLAVTVSACDLTKMNENPNASTSPDVDALMANAMRDFSNFYYDDEFTMRGSNLLAQYTTQNFYPTESTYAAFPRPWDEIYYPLNDLKTVIELNREDPTISASPDNYIAVSQISQSFMFHVLTDYYGDVPFNEALAGQENFAPAYTPQSEIYPSLLDSLDTAIGNIDASAPGPGGDVIFGGDMEKWERFANSLKLRIAMRMESQNGASGVLDTQSVYDNAMQSNDDNAYFQFTTSAEHRSDIYENRFVAGRDDFDASDRFVNALQQYSTTDPRAEVYFQTDINGGYTGFPYGLQQPAAQDLYSSNLPSETFSRPGDRFSADAAEGLWMNYDETLFIKAEAIDKGYISGNRDAVFEDAIRASIARWDLDPNSAQADAYIAEVMSDVSNNGFDQVLGEQKWIAFYFQGVQGWSTWRRLDFEGWILPPTGGNQGAYATAGESGVPLRYDYPQSEFSLNGDNVTEAATSQFGGTQSETPIGRIWWDTNPPPSEVNVPN